MKTKCIAAIILAVAVLCTIIAGAVVPQDGDLIEIPNASFETLNGKGFAEAWGQMNSETATIKIDNSKAHTGKNSLKISTDAGGNPWACTTVSGLYPGGVYEISAYLNTELTNVGERGAGFKLEHYKSDGSGAGGDTVGDTLKISTNAQWNLLRTTFEVPQETAKTKIYCRLYCNGTAWFDDISVKFTGGPEKFSFYSDHCFLYPDEAGGRAEVRLNEYYANTSVGDEHTVDFAIMDGEKVVDSVTGIRFIDCIASYNYGIDKIAEMHKKYLVTAVVRETATGKTVGDFYDNLYKYERPTSMTKDNDFVFNGEQFRPLIAYHCATPESYEKVAPLGFNVAQMGYSNAKYKNVEEREATLSALDAHGMKGLFCLYYAMKPAGSKENIEDTKKVVEEYKDDPRIFAWAVMDEPMGTGVTRERKDELEASYIAIRERDSYHPIYLLDFENHEETMKYCDVYVADKYCTGSDTTAVSKTIDEQNTYKRVNTYELAATYSSTKVMPTIGAVRNSIYRAFEGGSRGVGYYCVDDAMKDPVTGQVTPLYKTDLWESFVTFNKEEVPILFDCFTSPDKIPFNSFSEGEEYRELMWYDWFLDGQMYLVAHNRGQKAVKADIPLRSKNGLITINGFTAEPVGVSEKKIIKGNGSIELELGTEEVCLFKITPDTAVDLSRISDSRYSDLEGFDWASSAINGLTEMNVVTPAGEQSFAPSRDVTRGELGMFLVRALGLKADVTDNFADVAADAAYAKELAIGKTTGILKGVGDNLYQPESSITRQDLMTVCARGMLYAQKLAAGDKTVLDAFADKEGVADYAVDSVAAMIESGIINGDENGNLNPLGTATRAEAAVIMERIMKAKTVYTASQNTPSAALPEITFTDKPTEEQIAAWKESAAFLTAMGAPASGDVNAGIRCGEFEAMISGCLGYDYNKFEDDTAPLTYYDAVEALVDILGYSVIAQRDIGYLAKASQLELTKGIPSLTADAPLRSGMAMRLLDNAMDIPLLEKSVYGMGAKENYAESQDTLLSQRQIYKKEGRINATYYNAFGTVRCSKNQLALDGEVFDTTVEPTPYFGYRVSLYLNKENEVEYIRTSRKTTVTTVNGGDVLPDRTTAARLCYTDEADKEQSIAIAEEAVLLYNGVQKNTWTRADLTKDAGTITLIENGSGSAEVIMVDVYTDYVVKQTDVKKQTVYFEDGTSRELNPDNVRLRMTDCDGKPVVVEVFEKWNILSIAESADGSTVRAILSNKNVTGEPSELLSDGVCVAQKEYKYAQNVNILPTIGDMAVFYLNYADEIVAMDKAGEVPNYGYYIGIAQEGNIDKAVKLRIFTADSEMKVFPVKDKVDFNGVMKDADTLLTNRIMTVGTVARDQLIIYETNAADEISAITTAIDGEGVEDDQRKSAFTRDCETGTTSLRRCFGYSIRILAQKYVVTGQTVTFIVPETHSDNPDDYAIRQSSYFRHGGLYEHATLYDVDRDQNIGAVVQKCVSKLDIGADGATAVVIGPRKAIGKDGDTVCAVAVKLLDGTETTLTFNSNDFDIFLGDKKCITSSATETEVTVNPIGTRIVNDFIKPDKLCCGDVILYQTDTKNVITGMRVLMRANSPVVKEISEENLGEYYDYSQLTRAYGTITKVTENGIIMKPGAWERLYAYSTGSVETRIYVHDHAKNTIEEVDKAEIREGDKAFVARENPYTNVIVLYR